MRTIALLSATAILFSLLSACAHATPSKFDKAGAYTVCQCEGTERQPTPSEAESYPDDQRVDVVCEGKVQACHPGSLRNPANQHLRQLD